MAATNAQRALPFPRAVSKPASPAPELRDQQRHLLLGVALLLLILVGGLLWRELGRYREAERWVQHTYQVIAVAARLSSSLQTAENSLRSYVLTGDASFRTPSQEAIRDTRLAFDELVRLTQDNQSQQARLARLRPVLEARLVMLNNLSILQSSQGFQAALDAMRASRGPGLTTELTQRVAEAQLEERRLLAQRLAVAEHRAERTALEVLGGTGALVALLATATVLISRDARRRQEAEAGLRELAASLEQRVGQRTEELQEANKELEAYTLTVSHDLRAPLRTLQGLSHALLDDYGDRLDEEGRRYAILIAESGERLDLLIEDLLNYSRLSRSDVQPQPVSLEGVLRIALEQHAATIGKTHAEVTIVEPLPVVLGHPTTLNQVFANLLGNALKFVAPGKVPHVRVWAEPRGKCVRIWVEDNGIGIEPAYHRVIFDVFQRLHGSETYSGTGIGLAIVRKGVERMGGRVGVESGPGGGSRFWMELPGAPDA